MGAVGPSLNVSCWGYPLQKLLAIPLVSLVYQGLKGLVSSLISELGLVAPEPEGLPRPGQQKGQIPSPEFS